MGFSKIIIGLCIVLCFVVSSCAPQKIWAQGHAHSHDEQVHSLHRVSPTLARKLMHHHGEEAKVKRTVGGDKRYLPFKVKEQALSGKVMHKKEEDPSEFESMEDYNPLVVKKRHPVHNKFVPVAP